MNAAVGEKYTAELIQLFEHQGIALYSGQHSLCLTTPCLSYILRKFTSLQEGSSDPVPAQFANLQQLQDSLGRIVALKLISDRRYPLPPFISLASFKALQTLILKKIPLQLVTGLQRLRGQLKTLVIQRSQVDNLEDVIVRCGGDESTSFAWSSLNELDLSHNNIKQLGDSLQYLPCLEKVTFSNNGIAESTEGIECIDSVSYLHLGFNQLRAVPKFGSRAKYNLTVLNLRNNSLDNIEGVGELDSLVELDLTDNLLSRHDSLKPLRNLHHLALLTVSGNPLAFHHKHRTKTVENLSNLVNPGTFRLDGKKLSNTEKKIIPRSVTHFRPTTSGPTPIPARGPLFITRTVQAEGSPDSDIMGGTFNSTPNTSHTENAIGKKRRKKTRTVALSDSDEIIPTVNASSNPSPAATSVPLVHEQRLEQLKNLHKQLQNNWLRSTNSLDTTSSNTTAEENSGSVGLARSASQPPTSESSQPAPIRERHRRCSLPEIQEVGGSVGKGEEVTYGPRQSTPVDRGSTSSGVGGECFLVERYESDEEEEEGEGVQVLLTLSDRFLEEKDQHRGMTVDRLDLQCLQAASVDHRQRKTGRRHEEGRRSAVLVLQFSSERRDRRRREYVMVEGNHLAILSLLQPIIEQNQAAVSMTTRVECLQCQSVFDSCQAVDLPSLSPSQEYQQFRPVESNPFGKKRSSTVTQQLLCPFCYSQGTLLHHSAPRSLHSLGSTHSHSPKNSQNGVSETPYAVVVAQDNIQPGFSVENEKYTPSPHGFASSPAYSNSPSDLLGRPPSTGSTGSTSRNNSIQLVAEVHPPPNETERAEGEMYQMRSAEERHDLPNLQTWTDHGVTQYSQNPNDNLREAGDSKSSKINFTLVSKGSKQRTNGGGYSDSRTRLTHSEPVPSTTRSIFPRNQVGTQSKGDSSPENRLKDNRRHSSALEGQTKPWKIAKPIAKRSMNPFDSDYEERLVEQQQSQANDESPSPANRQHTDLVIVEERSSSHENSTSLKVEQSQSSGGLYNSHSSNPFDEHTSTDLFDYDYPPAEAVRPDKGRRSSKEYTTSSMEQKSERWQVSRGRREPNFDDFFLKLPQVHLSSSVPSPSELRSYIGKTDSKEEIFESAVNLGHNRSRSVDCHPSKTNRVTPPSRKKKYVDPFEPHPPSHSGSSASKNSSRKSSLCSLDSGDHDSLQGSRGDLPRGYSSGERARSRQSHSSSEKLAKGYSSGERHSSSRGYSSGERAAKGYSSGERPRSGGSGRRQSSGSDRMASAGSGRGKRVSSSSDKRHSKPGKFASLRSSSESYSSRKPYSPTLFYRDDDPSYIHNSLNLHLDMEVFDTDQGEEFRMIFRSPVVQYGHPEEVSCLVVVSNFKTYIYKIIAPESTRPDKWLQLLHTHPLDKLVFIDIGVGYQYVRVEFDLPEACYTFLIRDEEKCQTCSTKLAYVVSDAPGSSFRTVGMCPFSLNNIRHPDRALREAILMHYEKISGSRTPTHQMGVEREGEHSLCILAHRHIQGREQMPVTLVVTEDSLYLAREHFDQWPLPKLQPLPPRESLKPPFSAITHMNINDIEQIILDRDQKTCITLRFFKENVPEGESRLWMLLLQAPSVVSQLVAAVQRPWEAEFETALPISHS